MLNRVKSVKVGHFGGPSIPMSLIHSWLPKQNPLIDIHIPGFRVSRKHWNQGNIFKENRPSFNDLYSEKIEISKPITYKFIITQQTNI